MKFLCPFSSKGGVNAAEKEDEELNVVGAPLAVETEDPPASGWCMELQSVGFVCLRRCSWGELSKVEWAVRVMG